jgi:hypothetical protein
VPAGGLLFADGSQAVKRVKGFLGIRDGVRYILFLHTSSERVHKCVSHDLVERFLEEYGSF